MSKSFQFGPFKATIGDNVRIVSDMEMRQIDPSWLGTIEAFPPTPAKPITVDQILEILEQSVSDNIDAMRAQQDKWEADKTKTEHHYTSIHHGGAASEVQRIIDLILHRA